MKITPQSVLEQALEASALTEDEKEDLRDTHGAALVLMAVDIIGESESLIGGSGPGECDVPREVGSRCGAAREGLTAGAAWLRGRG